MLSERKRMACLENQGIDYNDSRYRYDSSLRNNKGTKGQIGYQNIKTITLDASNQGVRYTPVGAGIRIDDSSDTGEILITQIQSCKHRTITIKRRAICAGSITVRGQKRLKKCDFYTDSIWKTKKSVKGEL